MTRIGSLVLLLALPVTSACSRSAPPAPSLNSPVTLAIVNAKVWTGDPGGLPLKPSPFPAIGLPAWAAQTRFGKLVAATGSAGGPVEIIDAGGQFLVPGFIDSHVHFLDGGFRLASVQLRDAKTREEFVARIAAFAEDGARGHVDHRRRLGSPALGRRTAAARRGSTPSRRIIRCG